MAPRNHVVIHSFFLCKRLHSNWPHDRVLHMVEPLSTVTNTQPIMNDYRAYKELYKLVGFFAILAGTFWLAFRVSSWLMWAHQCISASI